MRESIERRAVHIAAVVMQRAGLCRYDNPFKCRRVDVPDERICVRCIERWLMNKAKKEIGATEHEKRADHD